MPFTTVRQPSDTELGQFIRQGEERYRGLTLAALVVADRVLLVDRVIRPALADGRVVITDRHIGSTLALQRIDGVDLEVLWEMNAGVLVPNLSVFLSAPVAVLEQRLNARGRSSRFENTAGISETESQFFSDAADFMERKGARVLRLSSIEDDADGVAAHIDRTMSALLAPSPYRPLATTQDGPKRETLGRRRG